MFTLFYFVGFIGKLSVVTALIAAGIGVIALLFFLAGMDHRSEEKGAEYWRKSLKYSAISLALLLLWVCIPSSTAVLSAYVADKAIEMNLPVKSVEMLDLIIEKTKKELLKEEGE
jgi:hypothetical protein